MSSATSRCPREINPSPISLLPIPLLPTSNTPTPCTSSNTACLTWRLNQLLKERLIRSTATVDSKGVQMSDTPVLSQSCTSSEWSRSAVTTKAGKPMLMNGGASPVFPGHQGSQGPISERPIRNHREQRALDSQWCNPYPLNCWVNGCAFKTAQTAGGDEESFTIAQHAQQLTYRDLPHCVPSSTVCLTSTNYNFWSSSIRIEYRVWASSAAMRRLRNSSFFRSRESPASAFK